MQSQDRDRFAHNLAAMAETFGRSPSAATLEGYWLALEDLPYAEVQAGIRAALRTCEFMPSPAALRRLSGNALAGDLAEMAWETARRSIGELGGYVSPDFEDRALNATIRGLGGWVRFTAIPGDELDTYTRAAFLRAYAPWERFSGGEAGERLSGIEEDRGQPIIRFVRCSYLPASRRRSEVLQLAPPETEDPRFESNLRFRQRQEALRTRGPQRIDAKSLFESLKRRSGTQSTQAPDPASSSRRDRRSGPTSPTDGQHGASILGHPRGPSRDRSMQHRPLGLVPARGAAPAPDLDRHEDPHHHPDPERHDGEEQVEDVVRSLPSH